MISSQTSRIKSARFLQFLQILKLETVKVTEKKTNELHRRLPCNDENRSQRPRHIFECRIGEVMPFI